MRSYLYQTLLMEFLDIFEQSTQRRWWCSRRLTWLTAPQWLAVLGGLMTLDRRVLLDALMPLDELVILDELNTDQLSIPYLLQRTRSRSPRKPSVGSPAALRGISDGRRCVG